MKPDMGEEKFALFSSLTEKLQSYMQSNKLDEAIRVAQQRHGVLVSLLENVALMGLERSDYALQAIECVRLEQGLARNSTTQNRSEFVSRKSAYKAYGMRTA